MAERRITLRNLDPIFCRKPDYRHLRLINFRRCHGKTTMQLPTKPVTKLRTETGMTGMMGGFGPVADGTYIPQQPFYSGELSSEIPMIICSTFYERSPSSFDSSLEDISFDKAKELAKTIRGFGVSLAENASNIIDAYAKSFPDKKPIEILSLALSNRLRTIETANAKAQQPAPVYLAWFGWNPPLFDGRLRAFHTMDIGFWFYNTDVQISHTGGGGKAEETGRKNVRRACTIHEDRQSCRCRTSCLAKVFTGKRRDHDPG